MRFRSALCAGALLLCACPPETGYRISRLAGTGDLAFNGDGKKAAETDFYLVSAVRRRPGGRLYVMDYNNHRLRAVDEGGAVVTVAGNGEHSFSTPGFPATQSPLENPIDFAFDPSGEIAMVSLHEPRVLRVREGGAITVLAGGEETGDAGDDGPALGARFTELTGVVVGADGSVFIADGGADRVRVLRPDGTIRAFAGGGGPGYSGDGELATAAKLRRPEGLALDAAGNLYIAEVGNHVIRKVTPAGIISTVVGTGQEGFEGDGGPGSQAKLSAPEGVAVGEDGSIYVGDSGNARVRMVDPAGVIGTIAGTGEAGLSGDGSPALKARLNNPSRLSLDGARVLVADLKNSVARVLEPYRSP